MIKYLRGVLPGERVKNPGVSLVCCVHRRPTAPMFLNLTRYPLAISTLQLLWEMGCPIINYVRPCEPGGYVKNSCLRFVCCVHRKLTVPNSPAFIGCRCTYTSTSTESMSLFIIMNNEELFKPGSMRPA